MFLLRNCVFNITIILYHDNCSTEILKIDTLECKMCQSNAEAKIPILSSLPFHVL